MNNYHSIINYYRSIITIILLITAAAPSKAFAPNNLRIGAGIVIGEPTGATVKYWLKSDVALAASIGGSYYGLPRITVDYLWHLDAFETKTANLYFGPGGAIGFGKAGSVFYDDFKGESFTNNSDFRMGVRGVVGINFIPKTLPIELYVEVGTLIGIIPNFRTAVDFAIGGRYYF